MNNAPLGPDRLLASTSVPLAHVAADGAVLWGNDAFARLCNVPQPAIAGRALTDLCCICTDGACAYRGRGLPFAQIDFMRSDLLVCPAPTISHETESCRPIRLASQRLGDGSLLLEFHDASEAVNLRQQLEEARQRDELTGLRNRHALIGTLKAAHASGDDYAILLIDIDRFKVINDYYGQAQGDDTLIALSRYVLEGLGRGHLLGRWSGHEFICLLPATTNEQACALAETIRHHVRHSFQRDHDRPDLPHTVTISIGVASRSPSDSSFETVIARADAALYQAKRRGRNRVATEQDFSKSIFIASAEIEAALQEDRLIPAYQPIVELATRRVVADEALARIRGRDGGLLPAGLFIEAASELQIAHRIDQAIVTQAIQRCASQVIAAPDAPPIHHFLNISTDLLRHPRRIEAILAAARLSAEQCGMQCSTSKPLVIEITERELVGDPREALEILRPFLDFGLQIAVDDFGSGYSSFLYLLDLPVTYLKIEGELVRRMRGEPKARAIIQGIQSIADQLGLITIAEFIEDEETARMLTDLGVNWGQGYLFGRPTVEEPGAACEPTAPSLYSGLS
ncbi:MAG: bifunctional diguanylate cyclase/phosphodiesterase [Pseudomonadota bacterium]